MTATGSSVQIKRKLFECSKLDECNVVRYHIQRRAYTNIYVDDTKALAGDCKCCW